MDPFFNELIKLGSAGLVIWVITAPLIKYIIDRSKAQDARMAELIDKHLAQDSERHAFTIASLRHVEGNLGKLEKVLTELPQKMMDKAQKVYPPNQQNQQPVTVNVANPGPAQTIS